MFDLTDKIALVTGATGGIGAAIARAIVAQGGSVAVTGTRQAVLDELCASIGPKAKGFVCDLGDRAAVDALAPAVEAEFGRVDILVNNAGITRDNLFIRMSDDDWDKVIEVNLTAAFRLTRAVLRGMLKRRAGRIIAMSSVVGVAGNAGQPNYAAAKAGLLGMTKSLAKEVGRRGITVNAIAPGYIATAMVDALTDAQRASAVAEVPADRFGTPEEIAAAVVFLASQEAAYITGQTLHINGGMHIE
ncbi:MAG: 3-oxoacyl-[acyl-carrier-protein] reductase [Bauldia sp.]|nr:3-oxoacyl-[acyl-carrier-protein] reductase [Bauldia sp.]